MTQAGFLLDLDRCTGCAACVIACTTENGVAPELPWRRVHTFNVARYPSAPVLHYSLACSHCEHPSCLNNCPANAYTKDPSTGAVLLDEDRCIGCRYCTWVCPYEAPQYNNQTGIMQKCTFCDHLQADGLEPACVTACPVNALGYETDPHLFDVVRPGFPDTGLRPAIIVEGDRRQAPPRMTSPSSVPAPERAREPLAWRGLRDEWSLWLFTSIAIWLVALFTASAAQSAGIHLGLFAGAGLGAMAISAFHLGKISRIWRGALNFRRSWISREVVFFSAFLAGACVTESIPAIPEYSSWIVAASGFAALLAMDMVYRVPGQGVITVPHSAMATLTAAFYIGILTRNPALLLPVAAAKLVLYLARRERPSPAGKLLAPVRIGVGLFPALAFALSPDFPIAWAIAGAFIGELIDRAEFYAALRFLTPGTQIDRDLELMRS
jgi:Fe-S-cluster-containing dehydrogenase component